MLLISHFLSRYNTMKNSSLDTQRIQKDRLVLWLKNIGTLVGAAIASMLVILVMVGLVMAYGSTQATPGGYEGEAILMFSIPVIGLFAIVMVVLVARFLRKKGYSKWVRRGYVLLVITPFALIFLLPLFLTLFYFFPFITRS